MTVREEQSFGIIPYVKTNEGVLFLIVRHRKGHWGFPKGHPDAGEGPIDTARRELFEETGVTRCDILEQYSADETYQFDGAEGMVGKRVTYYLGIVPEEERSRTQPQESDIKEARWVKPEEARNLLTFKEGKDILEQALRAATDTTPL